jgi:hypothetical protein
VNAWLTEHRRSQEQPDCTCCPPARLPAPAMPPWPGVYMSTSQGFLHLNVPGTLIQVCSAAATVCCLHSAYSVQRASRLCQSQTLWHAALQSIIRGRPRSHPSFWGMRWYWRRPLLQPPRAHWQCRVCVGAAAHNEPWTRHTLTRVWDLLSCLPIFRKQTKQL